MARSMRIAEASRPVLGRSLVIARLGLATVLLTVALALVGGAQADENAPAVTLGTITLADGTAVVTGSVNVEAGVNADLEINGQPVEVGASGDFSAVVDLEGEAVLVLTLATGPDESIMIRIPLDVLASGPAGVLDALLKAGVSIVVPPDGFEIVDGQMPVITGRVLNDDVLASLTINGVEILELLGPDGLFSIQLPGSGNQREVIVVVTDHRGVSQTNTFRLRSVSTVITTRAGASVSAASAHGVVIAKVRLDTRHLKMTRRLGVIVTVKDRRGFLIRGAALRLNGSPPRYLANGSIRAGFTNRLGQAKFTYRLSSRSFKGVACGHLAIVVRASTPTASGKTRVSLRLPTLAHA